MKTKWLAGAMLAASLGLSGCTMLDGFGGLSVGYGDDGYYDDYDPYYDSYGQASYYGWYDNYYYPGTGYYVYDRAGARHRWSDRHRHYWEQRRGRYEGRENWSGYRRDGDRDGRWGRQDDRDGRGRDWRRERRGEINPGVAEGARILGARPDEVRDAVRGTPRPRRDWTPGARRPAPSSAAGGGAPAGRVERSAPAPAARASAPEPVERASPPRERVQRAEPSNPNVRDE